MTYTPKYTEFSALPAWTAAIWKKKKNGDNEVVNKSAETNLWSDFTFSEPPALGTRIKVPMNGLGYGVVCGYFTEHGWLGVRVKLSKPPKWWKKQNADDLNRLATVFGAEIAPAKKVKK